MELRQASLLLNKVKKDVMTKSIIKQLSRGRLSLDEEILIYCGAGNFWTGDKRHYNWSNNCC